MWTKRAYLVTLFSIFLAANAFAGPGPVGWWKFDNGTGSTAYDSSGNNFHGSISGTYSWIPGYIGPYALDFPNGYVSIPDESQLRPNRLTVSVWLNLSGPQPTYARLLVKGDDNSETYNFQLGGYGLNFIMRDGGNVALANPLWPDEWIHIGGVYDGSAMTLYVNGELDNSTPTGAFTPLQSGGALTIAARGPDNDRRMTGSIDDVRIYNYGMTEAQIQEIYYDVRDPSGAQWPSPRDMDEGVYANVVLSWEPGLEVLSHEVYLGTDCTDVNDADTNSSVYKGSIDVNYYDPPGLLEFGRTYCWRIDEVSATSRLKGTLWSFTVDSGKAREPYPSDGGYAPSDADLSWTAAPLASMHDVYFGIDFDAVNNATTASGEYKVSTSGTSYDPGALTASNYYWRIDEIIDGTTVKGDVWFFSPTGGLHLKVDLGLPQCLDGGATVITDPPVAGTVKEGWWGFVASRWADMYMHDAVWERGENGEGPPPDTDGIAGSGVHVALGCGGAGDGGFHVYNKCRDNLGGDGCPSGSPEGDPIANGWYHDVDWGGEKTGDVLMRINGLPPGEYVLVSYHNHWEPCSQGTRNCLNCYSQMPNMPSVTAQSLPPGSLPGYGQWTFSPGTGMGVTPIQDAYDVEVTSVTSDAEVSTSTIRFHTDGSDVLIIYDGGDNTYPDPARSGREGSKGILNAFEIIQVGVVPDPNTAWDPSPADEADRVDPAVNLSWMPGAGAISHDVYFSTDSNAVGDANTSETLGVYMGRQDACEYDPAGDLELGQTYYWRIDEIGDPNIYEGSVWSFTVDDGRACCPSPFDGSTEQASDVTLSWTAGIIAGSHDVYFGTDLGAVSDANTLSPEYKGNQALALVSYDPPGLLDLGQTYYWRIDEINPGYPDSKGDVWSFRIINCLTVDDMESYCLVSGCWINETWLDYWTNMTGSLLFLEFSFVHGGSQSMRYNYDNDITWGGYSETERAFDDPCNWSSLGMKALSVYFYGDPDNDAGATEQMYMGLEDSSGPASYAEVRYGDNGEDMNDIKVAEWKRWIRDFSESGVDLSAVKKIYIGFGDRFSPVDGGKGDVYFDDIEGCGSACLENKPYADLTDDCAVDYKDLKVLCDQWLETGILSADLYPDGKVDAKDFAIIGNSWLEGSL